MRAITIQVYECCLCNMKFVLEPGEQPPESYITPCPSCDRKYGWSKVPVLLSDLRDEDLLVGRGLRQ